MAIFRSHPKPPCADQPNLIAEREIERTEKVNLKILIVVALCVIAGLFLYVKAKSDADVVAQPRPPVTSPIDRAPTTTPIDRSAAPIDRTTSGANSSEPVGRGSPILPDNRSLETPVPPKGPFPSEQ